MENILLVGASKGVTLGEAVVSGVKKLLEMNHVLSGFPSIILV